MAIIKAVHAKSSVSQIIDYVTQEEKTELKLISGLNCDAEHAAKDMIETKKLWHKTDKRQYDHYIQSFAPDENITTEIAHKIALQWAEKEFAGFESLVVTHKDREHIHSHIIVNSVSFETGKKIHTTKHWLSEAKEHSDEICKNFGLSITEKSKDFYGNSLVDMTEFSGNKYRAIIEGEYVEGKSWLLDISSAVLQAQKNAISLTDFKECLAENGITTTWNEKRKHVTFQDENGHKVRLSNIAKTFNIDITKEGLEYEFIKRARDAREQAERARIAESVKKFRESISKNSDRTKLQRQHKESQGFELE